MVASTTLASDTKVGESIFDKGLISYCWQIFVLHRSWRCIKRDPHEPKSYYYQVYNWNIPNTYSLMKVSCQDELASGTRLHAKAEALMIKSFTEILIPSFFSISFSSLRVLQKVRDKSSWYHTSMSQQYNITGISDKFLNIIISCWYDPVHCKTITGISIAMTISAVTHVAWRKKYKRYTI